jgi:hypothetical protein
MPEFLEVTVDKFIFKIATDEVLDASCWSQSKLTIPYLAI